MTHCTLSQQGHSSYHIRRMARIVYILFLFLLCSSVHAAYQAFTRHNKQPGLWGLLSHEERIEAYFFHDYEEAIIILDEGNHSPKYGSLEHAMKKKACKAGINGGYFAADEQRTPLGLVRHNHQTSHRLSTGAFTVAGVVYDTGSGIKLERSHKLSTEIPHMKEAIQGGPFLIEKGKLIPGLDNTKSAKRTFIATDGQGRWCIAITSPLTLKKLAVWLSKPAALGKFKVDTALNMDGGTSTALWLARPHIYKPPFKEVRNYIGVIPRTKKK